MTCCPCIHRDAQRCWEYQWDVDHVDNQHDLVCECECHRDDDEEIIRGEGGGGER